MRGLSLKWEISMPFEIDLLQLDDLGNRTHLETVDLAERHVDSVGFSEACARICAFVGL